MGRVAFMREPRVGRGEPPQTPICNLNIVLPEPDLTPVSELVTLEKKYGFVQETSLAKPELIHRADLRLSDIAKELRNDWIPLALQLDLPESDINTIRSENPSDTTQQALVMLRHWLHKSGSKATGNLLEKGLRKINREDIVNQCMFNVELVTDDVEKAVAKVHLDQSGFDTFKEELGSSRDASLRRDASLNGTFDEQDIMKEAESAAETSSESSDKEAHFRSETRHSEKASKRPAEAISQSVNKSFEEGPETLVQNITSALSETCPQNLSNGQVSDASVHEDDKSELTAATLSSEATAEMEVSSLEDKSQTETHVEKKEFSGKTGSYKQDPRSQSLLYNGCRRTINDVKSIRGNKRNNTLETNRRKVSFSINPWTMTTPASGRKKKIITRRNSWPPDSPRKLNPRRKYQQRFKRRDFPEPFWTDTYEWLIMQYSSEHVKSAPLVKLTEFVEQITIKNITPKADYSYSSYLKSTFNRDETNKKCQNANYPDVIGFYFIKSNKVSNDPKKYLVKLKKRCLDDRTNSSIHRMNPVTIENITNSLPCEKTKVNKTKPQISCSVPYSIANIDERIASDSHFPGDEDNIRIFESSDEIYVQSSIPPRSHKPLQSINLESFGDVMMEAALPDFDSVVFVKHKAPATVVPWNKENIKMNKPSFPNAKFPDYGEYSKIPVLSSSNKGPKAFDSRKPLNNKLIPENSTSKLPKDIDRRTPDFNTAPKDMPDSVPSKSEKTGSFKKKIPESSTSQGSGSSSSTVHTIDTGTEASTSSEAVASGQGHSNRSYARQLFEHDINAKKGKTPSKEEEASKSQEEKSKKQNISPVSKPEAKVLGESSSAGSQNVIPADVVGFSFLKSLTERIELEDTSKGTTFPASAIGYAFLNNLIEQQNRFQESHPPEKSIPASVVGLSFLKSLVEEEKITQEQPIPASVIGQAFLKNLLVSQNEPEVSETNKRESADLQSVSQPPPKFEKEPLIPSSVVGQAFLKTLVDTSQSISKPKVIPSEVVGQTFLKSLIEEVEPQDLPISSVIPANVLGQSFLKNLIEQSPTVQSSDSQTASSQKSSKGAIPATVLGQSFLKSLVQEGSVFAAEGKVDAIPATVVGQTFLKTLLESSVGSMKSDTAEAEKPIPSSVIGQTFMKSLIESSLKEVPKVQSPDLSADPSVIPASVVGQKFLKTLIGDASKESQSEMSQPISASVIGQSFLKSLMEEQAKSQEVLTEKPIPAAVVGQAFLKTLVEQEKTMESEASMSKPIPSTVVGQAFLKTLIDEGGSKEVEPKPIPSSVVGQTFLKSLLETGQTLASPFESKPSSTIPSTVVGQAFVKTLVQQEAISKADESSSKPIPSPVVGQAFIKSLLSEPQEDATEVEKPIPATVVGQAFLKTLLDQGTVTDQKVPQTTVESPSGESIAVKEVGKESVIPSTVLGQAFLKTLLLETAEKSLPVANVPFPESRSLPSVEAIPASVVGSFFLKTLVDQTKDIEGPSQSEKQKPLPASVIGQAFLKTLCLDVESISTPVSTSSGNYGGSEIMKTVSKCQQEDSLNGHGHDSFQNGCTSEDAPNSTSSQLIDIVSLSEIEEQNPIIPPPPEFSSTDSSQNILSDTPGTSADIDVTSGIIGELLNYTKMMHSVIESMQDISHSQASAVKKEPGS